MAGHSAQVHRMLIITEAAKRHRHEAGIHHQSAGPLHPSPRYGSPFRSTCSHEEGDEIREPIEKPDPAHAKCASQAILFRDSFALD